MRRRDGAGWEGLQKPPLPPFRSVKGYRFRGGGRRLVKGSQGGGTELKGTVQGGGSQLKGTDLTSARFPT